jgi:hypothetical protein
MACVLRLASEAFVWSTYVRLTAPSARLGHATRGAWIAYFWFGILGSIVRKVIIISDMSISNEIKQVIASKPPGSVFSYADFLALGSRAAVDQALTRLVRAGAIARITRGLYGTVDAAVEAQALARVITRKTGEHVGLAAVSAASGADGGEGHVVVPTTGPSRTIKAAGQTLRLRHMSQRKVELARSPKGGVLLALWTRGLNNLTTLEIQRATAGWRKEEIDRFAPLIPAWLRKAVQEANVSRKSSALGLSGAYDWSNANMNDGIFISKVLEKPQFEDVARLCLHFGMAKVRRVFRRNTFEPMTKACLTRMLSNISKGLQVIPEAQNV